MSGEKIEIPVRYYSLQDFTATFIEKSKIRLIQGLGLAFAKMGCFCFMVFSLLIELVMILEKNIETSPTKSSG